MNDATRVRGLRANIALDLKTAEVAFPSGRLVIPLGAIAIAAGIGFARPGFQSVYGESLIVIVVLSALGAFGRTIGTAAVLAYGVADFAHFVLIKPDRFIPFATPADTIGRVVLYGVLWLLVVYVPSIARRVEWMAETRRNLGLLGRLLASAVGAAVAGIGTYLWSNGMPYLVRTAFRGSPDPVTLQPQLHPELLAIGVAAAYFLVVVFLRRGPINPVELEPLFGGLQRGGMSGLIIRVLGYAVVLLGLSGLVSGTFDATLLIASFVIAEVGAWLAGRVGLGALTRGRSPAVITGATVVLAMLVVLVIGWVANGVWPQGLSFNNLGPFGFTMSRFWAILLALAISWPIARIGFSLAARARRDGPPAAVTDGPAIVGAATTAIGVNLLALLVGAALLLAMLLMPATALADNCASPSDCFFTALFWGAMSSFGFGLLAAANYLSPPTPPDSVPSNDPRLQDFNKRNEKSPTSGPNNRFNNLKRNSNDFFGGGY